MRSSFPCPFCGGMLAAGDESALDRCPTCDAALLIGGRFRLEELYGRGGTATVYGGRDVSNGRKVAVKILSLGAGKDWSALDLFEYGARVLQGLTHRGLPLVFDVAQDVAGRPVLVREAFDGGTLEQRVVREHRHLDRRTFRRQLEALLRIACYLHGLVPPVLHRGIRPSSIMFRTRHDCEPVLVDFETVAPPSHHRASMTLVGAPGYAAPEQLGGELSPAVDLYAIGATMLFVATHTDVNALPRHNGRFELDAELANLEPSVRGVLLRLVEPSARRRYVRAEEALTDLTGAPRVRRIAPSITTPLRADDPLATGLTAPPGRGRALALLAGLVIPLVAFLLALGAVGRVGLPPDRGHPAQVAPPIRLCTVRSEPRGAAVFADGVLLGRTPLTVRVRAPRVLLLKDGHRAVEASLPTRGSCAIKATLPPLGTRAGRPAVAPSR